MKIVSGFVTVSILFALYSCHTGDKKTAIRLYGERKVLIEEFENLSIIGRGKSSYEFSYYKGPLVNSFFLQREGNNLKLIGDTIQYPINEIPAFKNAPLKDKKEFYSDMLNKEFVRLLTLMDQNKVDFVSSDASVVGVDLKIYFGHFKALLFVKNPAGIRNQRWKDYVHSGEKFDENWYYVKDE